MLRSLAAALLLALGLVSSAHAQAVNISIANEGATGTTLNKLAKLTGAPSTAIIAATTDTQGILGIVVGWTGASATTGNAVIARQGIASCVFDGAVTAGDYVQISATTAGDCHDSGATRPTTGQILGRVLATNATPGTTPQAMTVSGPEIIASTSTIASGTAALGTGAISSGACATVVTAAATGVATTDVVSASFNGDPTAVTGYIPATTGMLTIISYPTANNVNFKVCNNTSASVTPGAITLNWRVVR